MWVVAVGLLARVVVSLETKSNVAKSSAAIP